MYYSIIQYSKKKLFATFIDYILNVHKYYDGRYIGEIFDDDDTDGFYRY